MNVKSFLSILEHARIHQAIRSAEEDTSADIVVFISRQPVEDPLAAANEQFRKLRLETAQDQNSLLIFLAPQSQKFAVVGGTAIHAKLGQAWWDELIALLTLHFKQGNYTEGMLETLSYAGRGLRTHFPSTSTDRTNQHNIVEG